MSDRDGYECKYEMNEINEVLLIKFKVFSIIHFTLGGTTYAWLNLIIKNPKRLFFGPQSRNTLIGCLTKDQEVNDI